MVPPGAKRHLKRPRTHSHLQMYWFIMTQAFLLFLRAMQASMASEQSYFTASLMVMSDLTHMPPGPWTCLRKTTVRLRGKVLPLFLGSPNFTCISSDASSRLRTDHKPLLKIFAPDSATPVLAAARLQYAEKKSAKNRPQNVSKVCLKICVECYKCLLNYRR